MDNQIVLKELAKFPSLRLNKHKKSDLYNAECITRNKRHRRKNVVGDISPNANHTSFILYKDNKWSSRRKLGINTIDELLEWIKKDIEYLSR